MDLDALGKRLGGDADDEDMSDEGAPMGNFEALADALGIPKGKRAAAESALAAYIDDYYSDDED